MELEIRAKIPEQRTDEALHSKWRAIWLFLPLFFVGCASSLVSIDPAQRERGIASVSDQRILRQVALYDGATGVRSAAVRKLNDQQSLAKVVIDVSDPAVRKLAWEKVSDQQALEKIAASCPESEIRAAAVGRITNQTLLAHIAAEVSDQKARLAAIKGLSEQTTLKKLVLESESPEIRRAAIAKILNQTLVAQLATNDSDRAVRMAAFTALTDGPALADLAVNSPESGVRRAAVQKLRDQGLLRNLAKRSLDSFVRLAANAKLSDAGPVDVGDTTLAPGSEIEERDWNQSLLKNSPAAYVEFWKNYPNTTRLKVLHGTLHAHLSIENFEATGVTLQLDEIPQFRQDLSLQEAARWKLIDADGGSFSTKPAIPNAQVILVQSGAGRKQTLNFAGVLFGAK